MSVLKRVHAPKPISGRIVGEKDTNNVNVNAARIKESVSVLMTVSRRPTWQAKSAPKRTCERKRKK